MRRYLRQGAAAEKQERTGARPLDAAERQIARELLDGPAAGNAVVVQRLLAQQQVEVPLRTWPRELAPTAAELAAELATVRFETPPGYQLQIDFGEKWVGPGGSGNAGTRESEAGAGEDVAPAGELRDGGCWPWVFVQRISRGMCGLRCRFRMVVRELALPMRMPMPDPETPAMLSEPGE